MKRNLHLIVWVAGILFAAVSASFNLIGWTNFDLLFLLWPVLFILSGVASLVVSFKNVTAYVLIAIGTFLIVQHAFGFAMNLYLFMPIAFVLAVALLFIKLVVRFERVKSDRSSFVLFRTRHDDTFADYIDHKDYTCVCGKQIIDLTKIAIDTTITLDITSVFGSITLLLPSNVNVIVHPIAFFSGIGATLVAAESSAPVVYVQAFSFGGGISITNQTN